MKASEIRDMTLDEMRRKVEDLTEALFNLRFQKVIGELENTSKIKQTRRDLARVQTIIREHELSQQKK